MKKARADIQVTASVPLCKGACERVNGRIRVREHLTA